MAYFRFVPFCAAVLAILFQHSLVVAADLEVVDSYWTNQETFEQGSINAPSSRIVKVEADRNDGKAVFAVAFVNRSRQEITSIRATISLPQGVKHSTSGNVAPKVVYPGIVRAGDLFTIRYPVEFDSTFDNRAYRCNIQVEYSQVQQNKSFNETHQAAFRTTGTTNLDVDVSGSSEPGLSNSVVFSITNRGTASATGVHLKLPNTSSSNPATSQSTLTIVGPKSLEAVTLAPGQSVELTTSIFANRAAAGTVQTIQASLSYRNACSEPVNAVTAVGVAVFPEQHQGLVEISPESDLPTAQAGKVTVLKFQVNNRSKQTLEKLSIIASPLVSPTVAAESLKIMGQQRWAVSAFAPDQSQTLELSVFTSRELIGRATSLRFSMQYEYMGQPHSQLFEPSLYVDGEINIQLRDTAITLISGIPNLTGNLLNEGAGTAQFSSIEITNCEGWDAKKSALLYLGELAENSPLPISIPLDPSTDVASGNYKFQLRMTFKDALKETQTADFSTTVHHSPPSQTSIVESQAQNPASKIPPYAGWLAAGVAIGLIGGLLLRRNRNDQLMQVIQQSKLDGMMSLDEALEKTSAQAKK